MEAFLRFARKEYQIDHWVSIQRDKARKKPKVTSSLIFRGCVFGTVLGIRSLLELDQRGRGSTLQKLLKSPRPIAAGSDTTILRATSSWEIEPLRQVLHGNHLKLRQQGSAATVLSTGKRVRLSIVDGTCVGGHWFSVLAFAGAIPHALDVEPYEGRGHELAASRKLIQRATRRLGKNFATHDLYDGLMACRKDFRHTRRQGRHLLVKTREETLEIIASSKEAWAKLSTRDLKRTGVEIVRGVDAHKGISWLVYAQGGMGWQGLEFPMKLAWVRETQLKGSRAGCEDSFWVLTTDESLKMLRPSKLS